VIKINAVKHVLIALSLITALFIGREYFPIIPFEYSTYNIGLLLAIVIASSVLPDLDFPVTYVARLIHVFLVIFIVYFVIIQNYLIAIILFAILLISYIINHRGFMHHWITAGILSLPLFYYVGTIYGVGFLVGYLSHLLVD